MREVITVEIIHCDMCKSKIPDGHNFGMLLFENEEYHLCSHCNGKMRDVINFLIKIGIPHDSLPKESN